MDQHHLIINHNKDESTQQALNASNEMDSDRQLSAQSPQLPQQIGIFASMEENDRWAED